MLRKFLLVIAAMTALLGVAAAPAFATDEDDCTMSFRCTR